MSEVCQPTCRTKCYTASLIYHCPDTFPKATLLHLSYNHQRQWQRTHNTDKQVYFSITEYAHTAPRWHCRLIPSVLSPVSQSRICLQSTRNVWTALAYILRNLVDTPQTTLPSSVRFCLCSKLTALMHSKLSSSSQQSTELRHMIRVWCIQLELWEEQTNKTWMFSSW